MKAKTTAPDSTLPSAPAEAFSSTPEQFRGMARLFRSLRHRDFAIFWAGNFLSNTGTWMQSVALGWLVLELTDSAWLLGLNGFMTTVPTLLFFWAGGAIADRFDRRRLMLVIQAGMLTLSLLLGTLTLANHITISSIFLISFLMGLATALNYPAYQALFPDLVEEEDLLNAVALNSTQFNMARAFGPTLAGLALGGLGAAVCFYLNEFSFLGLIVALLVIRPPKFTPPRDGSVWQAVREGFQFVAERRLVLLLLSVPAFLSFFALPFVILMPVFARDLLGMGPSGLGYLMGGAGLGAGACGLVLAYAGPPRNVSRAIPASALLFSLALLGFSASASFPLSFFLLFLVGATMVGALALTSTNLQQLTPKRLRGRVMSIYNLSMMGLLPLGSLQAGAVASTLGARVAIGYGAVVCLLYFAFLLFRLPPLWALNERHQTSSPTLP